MCLFIREDIFSKCHLYISLISKLPPAIINVFPSGTNTTLILAGCEFPPLHSITPSICMHECVRVCVCVRALVCVCVCVCFHACVSVMWWRAVLSWARAQCHWAHSDSLLHLCNHDASLTNERAKGGWTGLLWLPWQGALPHFTQMLYVCVFLIAFVSVHSCVYTCACFSAFKKWFDRICSSKKSAGSGNLPH